VRTVEKAYAYVVRPPDSRVLVFRHPDPEAGVQVPKGTVEPGETPETAVVRELHEEAGVDAVDRVTHLATDHWPHPEKPKRYRRHFFRLDVTEPRDRWAHAVTGGGEDDGLRFEYFWTTPGEVDLVRDMGDYLDRL
jgi:8-oxo-dGTP pyrophosphatase MutT (NUDIX family)